MIYREVASVYAMGTENTISGSNEATSPVKCAVDVWRYTNSSKLGKGESRLLEIANDKFEEYFEDYRTWDKNSGYEHDIAERATMMLNVSVGFYVYKVVYSGGQIADTIEITRGVMKW